MLSSPRVIKSLGQAEIDYMDYVGTFLETHEEVVWLYISMNESSIVDVSESLY